jgi:hypothetical protein
MKKPYFRLTYEATQAHLDELRAMPEFRKKQMKIKVAKIRPNVWREAAYVEARATLEEAGIKGGVIFLNLGRKPVNGDGPAVL